MALSWFKYLSFNLGFLALLLLVAAAPALAQTSRVVGTVRDETGGVLAGVIVELQASANANERTETDAAGSYQFESVASGPASLSYSLINFAPARSSIITRWPAG